MSRRLSEAQQREIAGRAQFLAERTDGGETTEDHTDTTTESGEPPQEGSAAVFDEWREQFESEQQFSDRLERLGISRAACRRAVGDETFRGDTLPEWVELLDELVAWVCSTDPDSRPLRFDDSEPEGPYDSGRPFGPLSAAVAEFALTELLPDRVGESLPADALGSTAEWLREQFQTQFVRILYVELKTFVAVHDRERAFTDPEDVDELPREYYEQFVDHLFDGGFADFCVEYPVFGRLVTTQLRQWQQHVTEVADRLDDDRSVLREQFTDGDTLGAVTELEPLAEDTHRDGRAITRVAFESGVTVVYKPRSVAPGATFYDVLDGLNDVLPVPEFRIPTYVERPEYGWMEWIDHEPCPDEAAVERYYERAGGLVCLCYLLEFFDCQYENLIAAGEHPLLVDAETVCHPFVDRSRLPKHVGPDAPQRTTVLLTNLLPFRADDVHGEEPADLSVALAGFAVDDEPKSVSGMTVPRVEAANSDVMAVSETPVEIEPEANVPTVDGEVAVPDDYAEHVVDGFRDTYRRLMGLRDDGRLSEFGVPDAFTDIDTRLIYRPTVEYARTMEAMSDRECMADGAQFELAVEELASGMYDGHTDDLPWALYEAERRTLRRVDPPRFTCPADGVEVSGYEGSTGVEVDTPGVERARRRIEAASETDLREQVELIRGCLGVPPADIQRRVESADARPRPVGDDQLVTEAERLFDRIVSAADRDPDGGYHWAGTAPRNGNVRYTVRSVGHSLYSGRLGVALFGAALYHVTGDRRYREFVLDTVQHTRAEVDPDRTSVTQTGITGEHGGCVGLGAVAYGLGTVGSLIDAPAVVDDAVRCVDFVTDEFLTSDETHDVVAGLAGTTLGFTGLARRRDDEAVTEAARRCGDALLDERIDHDGRQLWDLRLASDSPITGFAHGVGGVAFALARLGEVTGEARFHEAVRDPLAYEAETYSTQGWPDLRDVEWSVQYPDQWCHGAAGIGLSRLGIADHYDSSVVRTGINRAVDGYDEPRLDDNDNLCCGNAGRAEFCLEAAARGEGLEGVARQLVGGVIERRQETGGYSLVPETAAVTEPTLFHGLAGIGYTALRVVDPDGLPCPLLFG